MKTSETNGKKVHPEMSYFVQPTVQNPEILSLIITHGKSKHFHILQSRIFCFAFKRTKAIERMLKQSKFL